MSAPTRETRSGAKTRPQDKGAISKYFQDGDSMRSQRHVSDTAAAGSDATSGLPEGWSAAALKAIISECLAELAETVEVVSKTVNEIRKEQTIVLGRVEKVEQKFEELEESANAMGQDMLEVRHRISNLETQKDKLTKALHQAMERITETENTALNLERQSRSLNLRFGGIPETKGEICSDLVSKLLRDKFKMADIHIDNAHRSPSSIMKEAHRKQPRHIIVRFSSKMQRQQILRRRREVLKDTNVFVQVDLCKSDYQVKQSLREVMNSAYKAGKKVRFVNGKLFVDDKLYSADAVS